MVHILPATARPQPFHGVEIDSSQVPDNWMNQVLQLTNRTNHLILGLTLRFRNRTAVKPLKRSSTSQSSELCWLNYVSSDRQRWNRCARAACQRTCPQMTLNSVVTQQLCPTCTGSARPISHVSPWFPKREGLTPLALHSYSYRGAHVIRCLFDCVSRVPAQHTAPPTISGIDPLAFQVQRCALQSTACDNVPSDSFLRPYSSNRW